jgi:hypothetical protein
MLKLIILPRQARDNNTYTGKQQHSKRESPDVHQAPLQEGMYAVKQGSKKLELQVGSMALQVFKGGKPVENILYKDMLGWAEMSGGGGLEIELSDDRVLQVRKQRLVTTFMYTNDHFYQDRLGTNIGKTQKDYRCCSTRRRRVV